MTSDATGSGADGLPEGVEVRILEARAIDEMIGKIQAAAALPGAADEVAGWRAEHGQEPWADRGHDHAVVGQTLMYLHDAPDGLLVPHARYPDGTEKLYTDALHAEALF
jgi:hypothetical protein